MEIIVLDNPNAEKKMEKEVQKKTEKLISDISPEKYLVYFPLANILITWMLNSTLASYSPTGIFSSMSLTFFHHLYLPELLRPVLNTRLFMMFFLLYLRK
mgnify:CR=1 FL=1